MSNRAEQLSDRAKRGSDSEAKLDSPSERRSRKGKNLPRKGKCPRGQFPSLDTRLSSLGDTFFFLIWRLFNHKSMPLLGCHLWMPPAPAPPPLLAVNECLVIYKEPLDHYWDLLGEYGRHLWMPLYQTSSLDAPVHPIKYMTYMTYKKVQVIIIFQASNNSSVGERPISNRTIPGSISGTCNESLSKFHSKLFIN